MGVVDNQVSYLRHTVGKALEIVAKGDKSYELPQLLGSASASLEMVAAQMDLIRGGPLVVPLETPTVARLNRGQLRAYKRIRNWMAVTDKAEEHAFFVLRGPPGTGKTFLMETLQSECPDVNWIWTAPTNKATKELSNRVKVRGRTTFSALGLRMAQNEGELVMEYGKRHPYFPANTILVVDEASMVPAKLDEMIAMVRRDFGIKVLFVGDPYQLNPVGEIISRIWRRAGSRNYRASLTKVERNDSQLLELSILLKKCIIEKNWRSPLVDDHDDKQGIIMTSNKNRFIQEIMRLKGPEDFIDRKIVAWRNKTVDDYNDLLRRELFGFKDRFNVGERLLLSEPMEEDETIIGYIDDEFEVLKVEEGIVKADEDTDIRVHRLVVRGDQELVFNIPVRNVVLQDLLQRKSSAASAAKGEERKILWDAFWTTKKKFQVTRYGYALTAHRVQGTTLRTVFVDQEDILLNRNKPEAFRALRVAATRPTNWLISF